MQKCSKKFLNKIISFLMVFSLVLVGILPINNVTSYSQGKVTDEHSIYSNKIQDKLLDSLTDDNKYYDIMVILNQQAKIDDADMKAQSIENGNSTLENSADLVIGELKETALATQEDLIKYIDEQQKLGKVQSYFSFYILNSIHVIAKKDVILSLAKSEKVKSITENAKIKLQEPIEKKEIFAYRSAINPEHLDWNIKMVNADKVWDEFKITGKGVTVGIMDAAVNYAHDALKDKYAGGDSYYDPVKGTKSIDEVQDKSHGSHCMGTILGSNGNHHIGIAPDAKFITARVFGDKGESSADAFLKAAQWLLDKKPDVINNSWGGGASNDPWFQASVNAWRNAGILPVFASGNMEAGEPEPTDGSISIPSSYKNSLAVGAVDENRILGYFSKRGPSPFLDAKDKTKPELSAPGVTVRSVDGNSQDKYIYMTGTSMAAPHVTGVAALIKSANKNLTPDEIQNLMIKTASKATDATYPKSPNNGYGYGIVNAYTALSEIMPQKGNSTVKGIVKSNGTPIDANITIKDTNRQVKSDIKNGEFEIYHPIGTYEIVASKYGYETKTQTVTIKKDEITNIEFDLNKKSTFKISGTIKNQNGAIVENAYIRLIQDSKKIAYTDKDGKFEITDIPQGEYDIRIFKEDCECIEEKITLDKDLTLDKTVKQNENNILQELSYDHNTVNLQYDQNMPIGSLGYQGAAVRFDPKTKGVLTNISIRIHDRTDSYYGNRLKVSIKALDELGRTIDLMQPITTDFEFGKDLIIPIENHQVKVDKSYYVVVEPESRYSHTFLIAMDRTGDPDHSYVYHDSNFYSLNKASVYGALMIRSTIRYDKDGQQLNYNVEAPKLNKIYPHENKITGTAQKNQTVQIRFVDGSRRQVDANNDGNFTLKLNRPLTAGEVITAYAKNNEGILSQGVSTVVLTDRTKINELVEFISKYKDKLDADKKQILQESQDVAQKLLNEITEYEEKAVAIDKEKIFEYQEQIEKQVVVIKEALIKVSPEKKMLLEAIENAEKLLRSVVISSNGLDVPTDKDWVKSQDYSNLNSKIISAKAIYDKPNADTNDINKAINNLKEAEITYKYMFRKGQRKSVVIDDKYMDGTYEGEGRGKGLVASHVVITLKDGKIVDINISQWNESDESKKAIENDGFLTRIIQKNSIYVNKTNGYENECSAIVKAIEQALEKALKTGVSPNADKNELKKKMDTVKDLLAKFKDKHTSLGDSKDYVEIADYNDLKRELEEANKDYLDEMITQDKTNRRTTLLETAIRIFQSKIKKGEQKAKKILGYKEGCYDVKSFGKNSLAENEFAICINKDGKITDIKISNWADTPGYKTLIEPLIKNIIKENSYDVDVVAGATMSSRSVKNAVKDALEKSKIYDEQNIDKDDESIKSGDLATLIKSAKIELYQTTFDLSIYPNKNYKIEKQKMQKFINVIRESEQVNSKHKNDMSKISVQIKKLTEAIEKFKKERR